MKSFIIGLMVAGALAVFFSQSLHVRYAVDSDTGAASLHDGRRAVRATANMRTVKRGANDQTFQELKVVGPARASKDLAYEDAYLRAARTVQDAFGMRSELSTDDIKSFVRDQPRESTVQLGKDKDGKDLGEAIQVEMTLQIDQESIAKLADYERENRMTQRLHLLARALAVLVAGLFAVAGYVRLDEWSKGYYSGLLKAVSVVGVIGIGLLVWLR